jgi:hypothetical protein
MCFDAKLLHDESIFSVFKVTTACAPTERYPWLASGDMWVPAGWIPAGNDSAQRQTAWCHVLVSLTEVSVDAAMRSITDRPGMVTLRRWIFFCSESVLIDHDDASSAL